MQNQNSFESGNKSIFFVVVASILVFALGFIVFAIFWSQKPSFQNNVAPVVKKPDQKLTEPLPTNSSAGQRVPTDTLANQVISGFILDLENHVLAARMPEGHIKEITLDESISFSQKSETENQNSPQAMTMAEFENLVIQRMDADQQATGSEIALEINFKTYKTLSNGKVPASEIDSITILPVSYELTAEQKQEIEAQIKNLQGILEKSESGQ